MVERQFYLFRLKPDAAAISGKIFDVRDLSLADIPAIKAAESAGRLVCPTCEQPVRALLTEAGAEIIHLGTSPSRHHEPDDLLLLRKGKPLLREQLQRLFPEAVISINVLVETGRVADLVMVTPAGGKLAVEVQTEELVAEGVAAITTDYAALGIACLWLLDARHLRMTKSKSLIRKVTLDRLETALLANSLPLLFLDSNESRLLLVQPNPQVRQLAELGDRKIGRIESLIRVYPISQLRVRDAQWWLDPQYDTRAPTIPPLPDNLVKRLAKLQSKAVLLAH